MCHTAAWKHQPKSSQDKFPEEFEPNAKPKIEAQLSRFFVNNDNNEKISKGLPASGTQKPSPSPDPCPC